MPVKAKYIKDLPLKNVLDGSESLLVQDLNGTQQASLGTIVDEIKQNSQEKIREIESELNQTNAQLSRVKKNVDEIANRVEEFGAIGDGVADDSEAIQKAFDNGGVILFGKNKTYKFTKTIYIRKSNITINGNHATLKYVGDGTGGCLIRILGTDHKNYHENITLSDFTLDGTEQRYKGGSENDWKATSPQPRYGGLIGIEIDYAKNIAIKNLTLNDIYSNGIIARRCSHLLIDGNKLHNCSGGNIIKNDNYTGHDNFGDGIAAFFSYDVTISNNRVINHRTYKVSDQTPDVNQVLGQICGRSGLEFEYALTQNVGQYPPGYDEYSTTDGFGLLMFNNYVYGYTKGIHLEAEVRIDVSKNKVLKCHIGILHTEGDESIISDNYISNENLGKCPQIGYDAYCGGIALTEYDHPDLTLVTGNRIDLDNPNGENLNAITIGRSCVHLNNNKIKAKRGIYQLQNAKCSTNAITITNNELISTNDGIFIFKFYGDTPWNITNNVFATLAKDGHAKCYIQSDLENPLRVTVADNYFLNSTLDFSAYGGKNVVVSGNSFETNVNVDANLALITLPIGSDTTIKDNYFFVDSTKVKYIVLNENNSERTTIKDNVVDVRNQNDNIESCFFMKAYQTALDVSGNVVKLPADKSSFVMLCVNWAVSDFTLQNNSFVNAHPCENYILKSDSASINGHIEINNNNGVVPNTQIHGGFIDRKYYNVGDTLNKYTGLLVGNYARKICVKEGYYTNNQWRQNTQYNVNDVFYNGDRVYKVMQNHTSGNVFAEDANVKYISDLPVFEEFGAIN